MPPTSRAACGATRSTGCWPAADPRPRAPLRAALALLLGMLACAAALPADEGVLPGRVTRVIDGDTLDVLLDSGRIRVRLQGVDAPERDQPGGPEAAQWLRQLVQDREVLLEPVSQDRYERMVALVHLGEGIVNRELLRAGQAWAYRRYLRAADRVFCEIEAAARREGRGVWARAPARAPWEHRATRGAGPFTDFTRQSASDCWSQRRKP